MIGSISLEGAVIDDVMYLKIIKKILNSESKCNFFKSQKFGGMATI